MVGRPRVRGEPRERDDDMDTDLYRVKPATSVNLAGHDPADRSLFAGDKDAGKEETKQLNRRLEELQELLYAEGKHKVLIVLQAMDTGGKDGTIRHVFDGVNPQGVKVASFKAPTAGGAGPRLPVAGPPHTPRAPARSPSSTAATTRTCWSCGSTTSCPRTRWRRRYDHINDFERLLADEGTTILKFFLHISKDEQKERLQARLDEPDKRWKFAKGDLDERRRWDDYTRGLRGGARRRPAPTRAPWYVIPADRKWYRNLVISQILVETLEGLEMRYPEPEEELEGLVID